MKVTAIYKYLPLGVLGCGILGLGLRLWLLGSTDAQGYLTENPVAEILLTILAVAVPAIVFWLTRDLREATKYRFNFPPSPVAAMGTGLAAVSIGLYSLICLPGSLDAFETVCGILGLLTAAALGLIAWCRHQGKIPNFLLHLLVAVYLMLRIICQYRHWSSDPRLLDYCFQLLATICLMLAVYFRAGFAIGSGNRRSYAFFALTTAFYCCLSLISWGDVLYYLGILLWMLTDLCNLTPLRRRGLFHREKA